MADPQLQERIAQFRKMAQDDPDNELGHFRLGQLLMEDNQFEDAARSFQRTLVLSPAFSKVYLLLAQSQIKLSRRDEAVATLREGVKIADQRGDKMPRDDMAKLLVELGGEGNPADVDLVGDQVGEGRQGLGFGGGHGHGQQGQRQPGPEAVGLADRMGRGADLADPVHSGDQAGCGGSAAAMSGP